MIKVEISDVASMYLVCKRVKRQPYYNRGQHYSQTTTRPNKAKLFKTKEEAQVECDALNAKRKSGYKFRVEEAHKHYVNNWSVAYDSYHKAVVVKNTLTPVKNVREYGSKVTTSINEKKLDLMARMEAHTKQLSEEIQKLQLEAAQRMQAKREEISKIRETIEELEKTDLDEAYVKPFTTSTDSATQILFGKKEQPKEDVERSHFMMLPLGPANSGQGSF